MNRSIHSIAAGMTMVLAVGIPWFGGAAPLRAQCVYSSLVQETPQSIIGSPKYLSFDQSAARWMAVGVARNDPDDWDLSVHSGTAPEPDCVLAPPLASSQYGGVVDFVVGDFTHNISGTYYAKAFQNPEASAGLARWSSKSSLLEVNGENLVVHQDVQSFLDCYTVPLEGGIEYTVTFERTAGTNAKFFLFENPSAGTFWSSRSGATLEDSTTITYVPTKDDWYGIVVVNDLGAIGSYTIGIGSCPEPITLQSGTPFLTPELENYFELDQQVHFWTAVGYRLPGQTPSLDIYNMSSGTPFPTCFGGYQGGDTGTNWDAAVMATNCGVGMTELGKYYAHAPLSSADSFGLLEWDSGADLYDKNDPPVTRTTGSNDVIEIWNIWLQSGGSNTFYFTTTGEADLNLMLFHNPGGEAAWYDRASALFETSGNFPRFYSPPEAAWYGLAVVNDNGKAGTYTFSVNTCISPEELEDGDVATIFGQATDVPYWLVAQQSAWMAIGIRGTDDWSLPLYDHASGSPTPVCLSGLLKTADQPNEPQRVDLVAGDFHRNTPGDFYPRPHRSTGSGDAFVQWNYSREAIIANGPLVERQMFSDDVLHVFDLFLIEGYEYQIIFNRSGDADSRLLLFRGSGTTYWGDRSEAELEIISTSAYTPPATGYYGVVVVNDNGAAGNYQIGAASATVAADPGAKIGNMAIRSLAPNPTLGPLTIRFDLPRSAWIGFEIIDVTGRVVSRLPGRQWQEGSWVETWNGDPRARPGVYFVRMRADEKTADVKRFVLLE